MKIKTVHLLGPSLERLVKDIVASQNVSDDHEMLQDIRRMQLNIAAFPNKKNLSDSEINEIFDLIGVMKHFVAWQLGPEVEVPDELVADLVTQQAAKINEVQAHAVQLQSGERHASKGAEPQIMNKLQFAQQYHMQQAAKINGVQAPKGAEPQITNKWRHVNTFENYIDFDKELLSIPDEGNTSVDLRMTFDVEQRTCAYSISLHNNSGDTVDWEKEHKLTWDAGLAMLAADRVEVPAALMAQSAQAEQGGVDDLESVQQPIERPRGPRG